MLSTQDARLAKDPVILDPPKVQLRWPCLPGCSQANRGIAMATARLASPSGPEGRETKSRNQCRRECRHDNSTTRRPQPERGARPAGKPRLLACWSVAMATTPRTGPSRKAGTREGGNPGPGRRGCWSPPPGASPRQQRGRRGGAGGGDRRRGSPRPRPAGRRRPGDPQGFETVWRRWWRRRRPS